MKAMHQGTKRTKHVSCML